MSNILKSMVLVATLSMPGAVSAATLNSLAGGGTITVDDVTFSGFTFLDIASIFGGVATDPGDIDVTGSSTATSVTLTYAFDPALALDGEEIFEFDSQFTATVAGASSRLINSISIGLADYSRSGDSFVEIGSNTPFMLVYGDATSEVLTDSGSVSPTSNVTFNFFSQGETFDAAARAGLSRFTITLGLDSGLPPAVPLPASLPLLLGGVGLMGLLSRRKRAA